MAAALNRRRRVSYFVSLGKQVFRKFRVPLVIVIVLSCIVAGAAAALSSGDTIYTGVRIGGMDAGGMTIEQATTSLQPKADELAKAKVTLNYAAHSTTCTIADLGGKADIEASVQAAYHIGRNGSFFQRILDVVMLRKNRADIPINYTFDKNAAAHFMRVLASKIDRKPRDARIAVIGGKIRVTREKPGVSMDSDKSVERLLAALTAGKSQVSLAVSTAHPEIKAADLKKINGELASYSTKFKPWQKDRSFNLRLACKAINGYLLKPGAVFSYNKVVGPREKKYGFRDAPIFVNGGVEDGTGGGICQVSSTLYNAALLADLKVLRRAPHSRPVVYAPIGRDATVAYPFVDLRIRNTTPAPIYVSASIGKRTVNISLFGMKTPGLRVVLLSEGHTIIKAPLEEQVDETLAPGKRVVKESGRSGHRVTTYRLVKQNGKVVKRELISRDYYRPESRVVLMSKPVAVSSEPVL